MFENVFYILQEFRIFYEREKKQSFCAALIRYNLFNNLLLMVIKFIMILMTNVLFSSCCSKAVFVRILFGMFHENEPETNWQFFLVNIPTGEKRLFCINRFLFKNQTYHKISALNNIHNSKAFLDSVACFRSYGFYKGEILMVHLLGTGPVWAPT